MSVYFVLPLPWITSDSPRFPDFDECTLTPFLFNSKQRLFVAYDDATSIGFKAAFVKANGLAGVVRPPFLPLKKNALLRIPLSLGQPQNFYSSLGPDNGIFDAARSGLQGTFVATRRRDGWAEKLPEDGAFEGALADNGEQPGPLSRG